MLHKFFYILYDNLFTSLWSDPAKKFGSEEVRLQLRQNDKDPCSVVNKEWFIQYPAASFKSSDLTPFI